MDAAEVGRKLRAACPSVRGGVILQDRERFIDEVELVAAGGSGQDAAVGHGADRLGCPSGEVDRAPKVAVEGAVSIATEAGVDHRADGEGYATVVLRGEVGLTDPRGGCYVVTPDVVRGRVAPPADEEDVAV